MKESKFQKKVIDDLKERFDGCMVLKNDANYIQGIPDLLLLWRNKWAALEVKQTENAHHQPNQDYYVKRMNDMSCAFFISPENEEEVLNDIQRSFQAGG